MASFTLILTQAPLAGCSHYLALDFAKALQQAGHRLNNVFFYQEAVYVALNGQTPIQGQEPLVTQWQALAQHTDTRLQVCIANAIRRGLVDEKEQGRYQLPAVTLASGFKLVGLGEMAQSCQEADRVIQF